MDIERAIAENRALLEHCKKTLESMRDVGEIVNAYIEADKANGNSISFIIQKLSNVEGKIHAAEADLDAIVQEHSRKKDD